MIKVHFPEQSGVITSSYISYLFLKKKTQHWHSAPSPPWHGLEAGTSDKAMSSAQPRAAQFGGKSHKSQSYSECLPSIV